MTLLDTYSNHCGVKVPKTPLVPYASFFPVVSDRYITVQTGSGMQSKNYDHFNEVMHFLAPFLGDIKVIQIGMPNELKVNVAQDMRGQLGFYQSTYIVKNALLHLGNDSVWCHVAGEFNVPVVSMYGSTLSNVCKPYYSNEKSVFLDSHRDGGRATHAREEHPKTINFINPEDVAKSCLKALGLTGEINFKTIKIGAGYNSPRIDVVPDFVLQQTSNPVRIRMDLCRNEENLIKNLSLRKGSIVTYEPINPKALESLKDQIEHIEYKVWNWRACNVEFVKFLQKFPHTVSTELTGEELSNLKFRLFEFNPISEKKLEKTDEEEYYIGKFFKTKKPLVSKGKLYLSKWHWDNQIAQPNGVTHGPILNKEMLEDIEDYYIYEIT